MIEKIILQKVLDEALKSGGDFAEIFEEVDYSTRYNMLNHKVESANSGIRSGMGLRIYQGHESFYAYTNDLSEANLMKTADTLSQALHGERICHANKLVEVTYENKHKIVRQPKDASPEEKVALMEEATEAILTYDPVIEKAIVAYMDEEQDVAIANSDGKYIQEARVRTRLYATAMARDGELVSTGSNYPGARAGMEFYDTHKPADAGKEAARIAKAMLHAEPCPSGVMPVIIDNGFGGVIFHEACGHALEASSVARNHSVFAGKLGEKVAHECVTALDDGTIPNAWGSNNIDDEGNFNQCNVLIKDGVLTSYMVDTLNGRRMNTSSTSSSRRESYKYETTSRMTNTFIAAGNDDFDDMVKSIDFGLYAKTMGGGSVNPATGEFNFAVNEAYLIKNGKIDKPVKGASLIGNGADTLRHIDMVGKELTRAQGMCGAASGSIPTEVGEPPIRVSEMIVGGQNGGNA